MKMNVAINDDRKEDIDTLKEKLLTCAIGCEMEIFTYSDIEIDFLLEKRADLYFIDIDMPSINGIEIAERLEEIQENTLVIFYSYREDLVFESHKVNSLYFVRKAHLENDLIIAMNKVSKIIAKKSRKIKVEGKEVALINIMYIKNDKNYVNYYLDNGTILETRDSIKSLYKQLEQYHFLLIYHGILVNAYYIHKIDKEWCRCVLKNKCELEISYRKFKKVKDKYMNYLLEKIV